MPASSSSRALLRHPVGARATNRDRQALLHRAHGRLNLRADREGYIGISVNETTHPRHLAALLGLRGAPTISPPSTAALGGRGSAIPAALRRRSTPSCLTRVLRPLSLRDRDAALSQAPGEPRSEPGALDDPLGSCTMKLNATSEMIPVTWPEFADCIRSPRRADARLPPDDRRARALLREITGFAASRCSPTPAHRASTPACWRSRLPRAAATAHRNVCLIPSSAHGTNPASAQMCGMEVVVVACDDSGNIDVEDLKAKAEKHADRLAALMITYPSTHGVFEEAVRRDLRHGACARRPGLLDGANLNALVGLVARHRRIRRCLHLNLHKTFCIPHGGGGPGIGPDRRARGTSPLPARPRHRPTARRGRTGPNPRWPPPPGAAPASCRSPGCTSR
jgi:glycine dehydrogenase